MNSVEIRIDDWVPVVGVRNCTILFAITDVLAASMLPVQAILIQLRLVCDRIWVPSSCMNQNSAAPGAPVAFCTVTLAWTFWLTGDTEVGPCCWKPTMAVWYLSAPRSVTSTVTSDSLPLASLGSSIKLLLCAVILGVWSTTMLQFCAQLPMKARRTPWVTRLHLE